MNRKQKRERLKRIREDQARRTQAALAAYEATGYDDGLDDDEWLKSLIENNRRQRMKEIASFNGLLVLLIWGGYSLYSLDHAADWDRWLLASVPLVLLTVYLSFCFCKWRRQRQELV